MRLVVDASIAVKCLVPEEGSEIASQLLDDRHELLAPYLMAYEVGNALWRKARRGMISREQAVALTASLADVSVTWVDETELPTEAVRLGLASNHPIYDFVYVTLAQRLRATVVTVDARFANAVISTAYQDTVVMLGNPVLEG